MRVGCPKEIKNHEYRVGLTPASVREYVSHGHSVLVETNAGAGIGASANLGIDKKFVKDLEAAIPNNGSGIIIYTRSANPSALIGALEPFHGTIFQTTLEGDDEATLHRMLDQ